MGYEGSVAAVQIKGPQSSWVSTDNIAGAYWQVPNAPAPPLDVRVQDSNGGEVRPGRKSGSSALTAARQPASNPLFGLGATPDAVKLAGPKRP